MLACVLHVYDVGIVFCVFMMLGLDQEMFGCVMSG